jgi:HK97 family phage prohead protease
VIRTDDLRAAAAARRAAFLDKTERRWGGGTATDRFHARSAETMGAGTARRQGITFPAQWRAQTVERDGKAFYEVSGYATTWDQKYEMWDMFGPYEESVAQGAATETLAAKPDVVFLINHTGLALARTINGSLVLAEDDHGLADTAYLNPERQDARDLVAAIEDGVITEQSFAFRIDEGWWNDDFTEFKIVQFDINRGDTSAVNYGANPTTDIAARQAALLRDLRRAPQHIQRAAHAALEEPSAAERILDRVIERAEERVAPPVAGSVSMWSAILAAHEATDAA